MFADSGHRDIRPRRSRKTVLALLSELDNYNRALPTDSVAEQDSFANMLNNLRRIARPGSNIFLISDFAGIEQPHANEHLFQLAQHTQMTAIHCSDTLEGELPRAGLYAVTNGESRSELHTADKGLRRQYTQAYRERNQALHTTLQRLGIPCLEARTDQAPFSTLQTYYGENKR